MDTTTLSQLLTVNCKRVKEERNWTSASRIVGEAVEDCVITLPCPICSVVALKKYQANQKSKDAACENCGGQFQIKATQSKATQSKATQSKPKALRKSKPVKPVKPVTHLKLLGAEYNTTRASIRENNVHYIVFMYSFTGETYTINDVLFIDRVHINESCIVPRNPLSSKARRAGWIGCTLVFGTFISLIQF